MDEAGRLGAIVEIVNGRLRLVAVPAGPAGDRLVELARTHKAELLVLLADPPPAPQTARAELVTVITDSPPAWLVADPLAVELLGAGLPVELVADLVERLAITREGQPPDLIADLLAVAVIGGAVTRWCGGHYEITDRPTDEAQALAELVKRHHVEVTKHFQSQALARAKALMRRDC